ncbi:hypothetical protein BDZ45DRAFT_182081 [Acephala macrosclerotiorum]|nr:hypothetical protein BDZ45DRAFT_182081 [Acephala macrosclerotiorum]
MLGVPSISSQYPGLASCLPAGPSMIHTPYCTSILPTAESAGGDLTSSTTIFVTPGGTAPDQPPSSPTSSTTIYRQSPGVTDENSYPSSWFDPEESVAPVKPPKTGLPAISMIHISGLPLTFEPPTSRPVVTYETPVPEESFVPVDLTSSSQHLAKIHETISVALTLGSTALPDLQTTQTNAPDIKTTSVPAILPQPASISLDAGVLIANAIASVMGLSPTSLSPTTISGTPEYVITALVTTPLLLSMSISGSTTVISETPNIVFPSIMTIPAAQPISSLPGVLTDISGTPNVVISGPTTIPINPELPGLSGSTTVISGSSYVIVPSATTIPVALTLLLKCMFPCLGA